MKSSEDTLHLNKLLTQAQNIQSKIQSMTWVELSMAYFNYLGNVLIRKSSPTILWNPYTSERARHLYQFAEIEPLSKEEYMSPQNYRIDDCGENWREQGFATRYKIEYFNLMKIIYLSNDYSKRSPTTNSNP